MATKSAATKTASKAAANKASVKAAKPAAAEVLPATGESLAAGEPVEAGAKVVASMKVKDLIERVAASAEQNKKDVRAIVEATLTELGKALEAGESLNLPPLGKVRIANRRSDETGQMMTLKLRRGGEKRPGKNADKEALAEVGEAS